MTTELELTNPLLKEGHTTSQTAISNGRFLKHFGITEYTAEMYSHKPENIIHVNLKVSANQVRPNPYEADNSKINDYWGWYDYSVKDFTFIYNKKMLLDMCFPDISISEERGQGKAYRLEVIGGLYV